MSDVRVSPGDRYRRRGALELLAAWAGRLLPGGALRDALRDGYRRLLGDRSLVCTLPAGERVRISARHRFVTWNPAEYDAFRAATAPGAAVLDVGANVGAYTLLFGQWVGAAGRVYAFEPAGEARGALRGHVSLNGLTDTVEVVPAAVSASSGEAILVDEGIHGTSRLAGAGGTTVATVSIDDFCAERGIHPTVIKVDVEGAELQALQGARRTLARGDLPFPALFVELHPTLWAASGTGRDALEQELDAQGLRVEALRAGTDPWTLEGECVRVVRK
jgi:FkbM family methyltransferase